MKNMCILLGSLAMLLLCVSPRAEAQSFIGVQTHEVISEDISVPSTAVSTMNQLFSNQAVKNHVGKEVKCNSTSHTAITNKSLYNTVTTTSRDVFYNSYSRYSYLTNTNALVPATVTPTAVRPLQHYYLE